MFLKILQKSLFIPHSRSREFLPPKALFNEEKLTIFRKTDLRHENRPRQVTQPPSMGSRQPSRENPRMPKSRIERRFLPLLVQESLRTAHGSRPHDAAFQQNEKSDLRLRCLYNRRSKSSKSLTFKQSFL